MPGTETRKEHLNIHPARSSWVPSLAKQTLLPWVYTLKLSLSAHRRWTTLNNPELEVLHSWPRLFHLPHSLAPERISRSDLPVPFTHHACPALPYSLYTCYSSIENPLPTTTLHIIMFWFLGLHWDAISITYLFLILYVSLDYVTNKDRKHVLFTLYS